MKTLLLDRATWDLAVDAQGNIAVADVPYATAQDVSSAVRVFRGSAGTTRPLACPIWRVFWGATSLPRCFGPMWRRRPLPCPTWRAPHVCWPALGQTANSAAIFI